MRKLCCNTVPRAVHYLCMTLRALLAVSAVYLASTACDAGLAPPTPADPLATESSESGEGPPEGTDEEVAQESEKPADTPATPHESEDAKGPACLWGEVITCQVVVPDFTYCYEERVEDDKCVLDRCLVQEAIVPLVMTRTECTNVACPSEAIDSGTMLRCAESLRDEALDCLDSNPCSGWRDRCPLAFSALERVHYLAGCVDDG